MASNEPTVWGIHAGKTGDAHNLFLKKQIVALGWPEMGDLTKLPANREAYKVAMAKVYPDKIKGAIQTSAGQLFRFVYELKVGDIVCYPSKTDRQIHIGRVEGEYTLSAVPSEHYIHQRATKWLKTLPRTHFTQGALYELGSAMSFFQVKTYAEEFLAALAGKVVAPPTEQDETIAIVSAEIEQTTRDFVLKRLAQELKGHPFAEFVAHLLGRLGYRTKVSPPGADMGVDILAHRDELGFEPPIIKVQVKSSEGKIGDPVISSLYGKLAAGEYALVVTLGTYTPQARSFAQNKSNLRLIDGDDLVNLILEHYDEFDSRYKGLIPLRRVYVPEPLEESQ